ncbi:MAG: SIMPL domain-containing protein [Chlorobiaceae bacterium]|nr:SIMPL domain-containing protein [Chlorobiales bacterium]NTU90810.1 SIMPL domain-containing protein [Chlorobiaceae bacterium]
MKAIPVVLFASTLLSFMPVAHAAEEGISVTATGTVKVMPDMAVFDVVVQSSDKDAGKATSKTAETVAVLQKSLRSAGIPAADATTAGYSVSPEWSWSSGKSTLRGYIARHVIRVSVRELRLAGAAVDAAVQSGAGEVGQIRFVPSRYENLRKDALDLAVRNARADADVIARAAGGRLGALIELNSGQSSRAPMYQMEEATLMKAAPAAPPTEITPGEQEISVTVQSRWRFATQSMK